jgi:CMP-N-acetylneuraminic acid synthetase
MTIVAFIFCRGGSKGLPGKNIRLLGGKPLIAWSIDQARSVKCIDRVIVSTDCEDIAAVARNFGAEVPFIRPKELAQDESSEWLAWRHALSYLYDSLGVFPTAMVSVPATAPLRLPLDIEKCIDLYEEGGVDIVITTTTAHRNPYFNMVKVNSDGTIALVNTPDVPIVRRQDAPKVFDMATVCYVANPEFVMTSNSHFEGRVKAVNIPPERSIDIDTLLDFEFAEYLLNSRMEN